MQKNKLFLIALAITLSILVIKIAFAATSNWQSITSGAGDQSSSNFKNRMDFAGNAFGPTESSSKTYLGFLAGLFEAEDTTPPVIENVRFNDREVMDDDYINYDSSLTATVYDNESGVNTNNSVVTVDDDSTAFVDLSGDSSYVGQTLTYKFDLDDGDHTVKITAFDNSGNSNEYEVSVKVDKGDLKASQVLVYPNPWDPNQGVLTIGWMLSKDASVTIYVFNAINHLVYRKDLLVGEEGTFAGYNKIYWNGTTNFNEQIDSGIFFVRVVAEGKKVIGKVKLGVLKH